MKVSALAQAAYRNLPDDFETRFDSGVTTPWHLTEPGEVRAAFRDYLDCLMLTARLGFDGVGFTEHGQSSYDMVANPSLVGAALGYATEAENLKVAINPVGRSLGKAREPVRVAEEYAMIDCISGGRLIAGFPVGLLYDASINNGVPPIEVRARFDENLLLVLKAWRDKAPFAWNGKFAQHPCVNIWPRPLQQPLPPVWITGIGNPTTFQLALENNFGFNYFGWFGAKLRGRRIFERFWEMAFRLNVPQNAYRMGFMQTVCVAETDSQAERKFARHIEYFFNKGIGAVPLEKLAIPGGISLPGIQFILRDHAGDFGFYAKMRTAKYAEIVDAGAVVCGSPDTVTEQLIEIVRTNHIGNLMVMLKVGSMTRDLTEENVTLFAQRVLPKLRQVWANEPWEHHWWPSRLGGRPMETATKLAAMGGVR
jgi:alkanesulfonate monooxygenase SsuD/methylene tetrahydromethanopterin reductase-like flavin-dependent oxidoreductase (luciferase family)